MLNSLDDIEIIEKKKILGEGAFSKVLKVYHKKDKKTYALKKIDLTTVSREDTENLRREIKLHEALSHKHIIKYHDALQIKNMVYLLLEHAENGCLFFYINSKKGLPEALALRFFYQIAKSINHLHSQNVVHRDIKPENVLLDSSFNAKLCDFGWACHIDKKNFRTSVCGTYEYMSPEIVNNGKHTSKVDIWCLGIMLYEMLHGSPPFEASCMKEIKKEFGGKKIMIDSRLSKDVKDLLKGLLRIDFRKRLCIEEVLQKEIFTGVRNEIERGMREEHYEILMKNYLDNVRSEKRNLPKAVSDYLERIKNSGFKNKKKKQNNSGFKNEKKKKNNSGLKKKLDFKNGSGLKKKKKKIEVDDRNSFFAESKVDLDFNKFENVDFFNEEKKKSEKKKKKKVKSYYISKQFKSSNKNKKKGLFENKTLNDLDENKFEKQYQSSKNIILTTSQHFDNNSYLYQNSDNVDFFQTRIPPKEKLHNFENNLYKKNELKKNQSLIKIPTLNLNNLTSVRKSKKKNIEEDKKTDTEYNFYKNNEYYQDFSKINKTSNFFNFNTKSHKNIKLNSHSKRKKNIKIITDPNLNFQNDTKSEKNLMFKTDLPNFTNNINTQKNLKLIRNPKNFSQKSNLAKIKTKNQKNLKLITNPINNKQNSINLKNTKSEKNINIEFKNFNKSSNFFNLNTKSEKNIKTYNELEKFNEVNFFDTNKEETTFRQKYKKTKSEINFNTITPKSRRNTNIDNNLIYNKSEYINKNTNFDNNFKNYNFDHNEYVEKNINYKNKKNENENNLVFNEYLDKNLNFDNNLYEKNKNSNLGKNEFKDNFSNFQNKDNSIQNFPNNEFKEKNLNFEKKEKKLEGNENISKKRLSEINNVSFYKNNRNRESYSSLTFVNANFDDISKTDINSEYDYGSIRNPSIVKGLTINNLDKKNEIKKKNNLINEYDLKINGKFENNFEIDCEKNFENKFKNNLQNYSSVNLHDNLKNNFDPNFDSNFEKNKVLNFGDRKNSEYRIVNKVEIQKPLTSREHNSDQNRNNLNLLKKRNSFQANFKYICENGVLIKIPLEKKLKSNDYNSYINGNEVKKGNDSFSFGNKISSFNFNIKKTSIDKKISKKLFKTESKSPIGKKKKKKLVLTKSKKKKMNSYKKQLKEKINKNKFQKDNIKKMSNIMKNLNNFSSLNYNIYNKKIYSEKIKSN